MEELQISGRRYISSRRVAKDNGYHTDYIGQLIRGGKIRGQKVGRAWYVDADSFGAYLRGEGAVAVEKEIKKTEDPVPEPAEALSAVSKEEVAEEVQKEEEVSKPNPEPEPEPESEPESEPRSEPEPASEPEPEPEPEPEAVKIGLRYYSDDAPLVPEIPSKKTESRVNVTTANQELSAVGAAALAPAHAKKFRTAPAFALFVVGIAALASGAVLSSGLSLNINIDKDNSASAVYSFNINDSASLIKTVK